MSNCPGIYPDIGVKARDLLYKDYGQQPPIHFHYRHLDWSCDLSCRINEILPGLRTAFKFIVPYQNKAEVQYLQDYVGITAGISLGPLGANPLVHLSGVVGNSFFSMGTDLSFDVATKKFDHLNAGLSLNSAILSASLTLDDIGDTLRASCYHTVNPLTNTAIAAELQHKFLTNETTVSLGTQHSPFPITLVKARVSSNGKLGALIQQQLLPPFFLTLTGDVDVMAVTKSAKLGLSLAIRPPIQEKEEKKEKLSSKHGGE